MIVGPFTESGLTFTYDDTRTFRPDEDALVRSLSHIKAADFVSLHNGEAEMLFVVEMKSSAPIITNDTDLPDFLQNLHEKLINSILLLVADIHGRQKLASIPTLVRGVATLRKKVRFVLLLSKFKAEWCPPLQDELRKKMNHVLKSYAHAELFVVSLALAHQAGWFNTKTLNITAQ
ncbi:MAG: hypothetical protein A2051_06835 [Desulfovibrionales bacterium GWA2_65_9]|nr:MAG: hypothetical protein A2051_06835 [Desulfovibrionales bacterium GWA2_65_9]